jgi:hypothetical protein
MRFLEELIRLLRFAIQRLVIGLQLYSGPMEIIFYYLESQIKMKKSQIIS